MEQLGLQVEVRDVACNGEKTLFPSVEASADGTVERRWAGGPADLVGRGRGSSPISLVSCGRGQAGPSKSSGPSVFSCGEAQVFNRMDLGQGPRPNPCSFSEGMSGEAGGPIQARALLDEVSDGFVTPSSLPRA